MKETILAATFLILIIGGYIINLITLINSALTSGEVTMFLILQGIGVMAWPLGILTGWISLFV